jgi:LysM repeat protein
MRHYLFILLWVNVMAISAHSFQPNIELRDSLVQYAKTLLHKPYRSGSKGPDGFDCSGFTHYVYQRFGLSLGASSRDQVYNGKEVTPDQLKKGDLVFFKGSNSKRDRIGHVGIVISPNPDGGFTFIHAASDSGVRVDNSSDPYYSKRFVKGCDVLAHSNPDHYQSDNVEASSVTNDDNTSEPIELAEVSKHRVKEGESLYFIAHKYQVSEKKLKEWNHLSSNTIQPGEKLIISKTEKHNKVASKKNNENSRATVQETKTSKIYTRVKPGESLYTLARKYHVSAKKLKEWNNLSTNKIKVGENLVVKISKVHYDVAKANDDVAKESTSNPSSAVTTHENKEQQQFAKQTKSVTKTVITKKTHRIRSGESLYSIAEEYHTHVATLKRMNHISSSILTLGKYIIVGETKKEVPVVSTRNENQPVSATTENAVQHEPVASNPDKSLTQSDTTSHPEFQRSALHLKKDPEVIPKNIQLDTLRTTYLSTEKHVVQPGETMASIAEKYNITIEQLKDWNGIPHRQKTLTPGMGLILQVNRTAFVVVSKPVHAKSTDAKQQIQTVKIQEQPTDSLAPREHIVKKGESINSIANQHHISVAQLRLYNHLRSKEKVKENQVLRLTPNDTNEAQKDTVTTQEYFVKPGDTLLSVAKAHHVSINDLKQINQLLKNDINIGQHLLIPVYPAK